MSEPVKPVGPYTPLVKAGPWLVCSGQVGIPDGAIVEGGLEAELRQAFRNLRGLLEAEGATLADVTKTAVFLVDMADFAAVNEVYGRAFGDHKPARACVAVKALPKGALVEIDCIAQVR